MKKKLLLPLIAAIVAIGLGVFVWVVVLPTRPGVTKANFDRIGVGLTYEEVVQIFGEEPTDGRSLVLKDDGRVEAVQVFGQPNYGVGAAFKGHWETWSAADGSSAVIWFTNSRVAQPPVWFTSTETFWDKLRRWVDLK